MLEAVESTSKRSPLWQWGLVVVLAIIVAIAAVPGYFQGQWPWMQPLEVPHLKQIRALRQTPLAIPDWNLTFHQEINISGHEWALSEYVAPEETTTAPNAVPGFALLLRPQPWYKDQPEVEWVDIAGAQGWQTSDLHTLRFTVAAADGNSTTVTARYFRGIQDERTFAVLQWYAWPTGGHPAPSHWFWVDQARQWGQRERMPWIAVSILMPIEPVGNIRPYADTAISIGQAVQASLLAEAFAG